MTEPTTTDLWHAAGRAARDGRKRFVAFMGVLFTGPVLWVGALLARAVTAGVDGEALRHPVAFVLGPLRDAWLADDDLGMLAYVAWQALLWILLWAWFSGVLSRLAAVDLALGRKEEKAAAAAFARRHWRDMATAHLVIVGASIAPFALAALLSTVGRIDGALGAILLAVVVVVVAGLALVGVVVASVALLAGFLTAPTIACEDSDAFDAVSRTFTYAGAGLPRLVAYRLRFAWGVLLGVGWRALRTVLAIGIGLLLLRLGAGPGAVDRALAVLAAMGTPADGARLGITAADHLLAAVMALAVAGLAMLWLADMASRIACARVAVYLLLRREIDGIPVHRIRTLSEAGGPLTAARAGFVEVGRVGEPAS